MRLIALLFASALLVACQTGEAPADVEPTPAAEAPVGTAGGGVVVSEPAPEPAHFGEAFTLDGAPIKAADLLEDPASYPTDGPILVEGTVVDVCQKAGCWMVMSDGENQIRVTMKEHGFAVDKQGTGSWATVQGTLEAADLATETVEHFEGESQRPDLIPEKAGQTWQIIATGVAMKKAS